MNRRASCFNASSSFAAAYSFTERFCAASRPWLLFHPAPHGIPLPSFSLFISHPCVFLNNASTRNSDARAHRLRVRPFSSASRLPARISARVSPRVFRGRDEKRGEESGGARFPLRGRGPHKNRTCPLSAPRARTASEQDVLILYTIFFPLPS